MKKRSKARRYRSAEEWRAIIREQAESGLTIKDFCKRGSICAHVLYRWRRKLGSEGGLIPAKFVEIQPAAPTDGVLRVELQLPNGAVLRIA